MNTEKVIKRDQKYIMHTYARSPLVLEHGEGMYAYDADGKAYLDFTSGIGVNALGYCHPAWVQAVTMQATRLQHSSNLYYTAPCGKLAKRLCARTGKSTADVAVIPLPDFKQKMVQIGYLARTANLLGIATPKIACIAPSEQLLPNVISSTEGALLAKMADRGQLGNVVVDGPLSLDVALYKEVAEHKKVKGSSVAGDPDCLLFPNLESANVFFKSVTHLCGGELAAMVMGTKVPCVLTSRGDTSKTKLFSIALACLAVKK